jgi:hypothetical protein
VKWPIKARPALNRPKKIQKKFHPDLKAANFPIRKSFLHITKTQQAKHRRLQSQV